MAANHSNPVLSSYVRGLRQSAVTEGRVPQDIADRAAASTLSALGGERGDELLKKRARAYFWAVIRRSVMRSRGESDVRARFLLSAVVDDLVQIGRRPLEVWEELERGWADRVPKTVLEEYRERLCA